MPTPWHGMMVSKSHSATALASGALALTSLANDDVRRPCNLLKGVMRPRKGIQVVPLGRKLHTLFSEFSPKTDCKFVFEPTSQRICCTALLGGS